MRDIYKTAKKAQMAPVRGRVKAMMAQPRAIPQARKIARQTTGFARGGVPEDKKKRKPGPQPGLRRPRPKAGPGAPSRPRPKAGPPAGRPEERPKAPEGGIQGLPKPKKKEEGMYVQKGGVMEKRKTYELANALKNKDRLTEQDIKRAEKLTESFGKTKDKDRLSVRDIKRTKTLTKAQMDRLLKQGQDAVKKLEGPNVKAGREKAKEHKEKLRKLIRKGEGYVKGWIGKKKGGKVDKKWIQKAVDPKHKGYCTPMTKPTCTPARKRLAKLFKSKAKKGWANGGTVVMPTVGKDSFMRTYKHGAVISPRPRPTVPHGSRMRGTGIAKRGW